MKYCAACEGENHGEFGVALGRFISFTEGLGTKTVLWRFRPQSFRTLCILAWSSWTDCDSPAIVILKLLNTLTMLVNAQLYINSPSRLEHHSEHTAFSETLKCLCQEKKLRYKHYSSLPFPFYQFLLFKDLTAGTGAWREREHVNTKKKSLITFTQCNRFSALSSCPVAYQYQNVSLQVKGREYCHN